MDYLVHNNSGAIVLRTPSWFEATNKHLKLGSRAGAITQNWSTISKTTTKKVN